MAVYDKAHELAKAIKESEEYMTYKQIKEKMKKLQDLYVKLMEQEEAKKYFDCEVRFNIMLADMNKIIGEAVQDVLK